MSDDRVSAELAAIRERFDSLAARYPLAEMAAPDRDGLKTHGGHIATSVLDVPRLLAAVEAVLAMHQKGRVLVRGHLCDRHEAHAYFSIDSHEQADVLACPDCTATVSFSCTGCHASVSVDACPVRAVIERELTQGAPETGVPATTTTGD